MRFLFSAFIVFCMVACSSCGTTTRPECPKCPDPIPSPEPDPAPPPQPDPIPTPDPIPEPDPIPDPEPDPEPPQDPDEKPFCVNPNLDPVKPGPYSVREKTEGSVKLFIPQGLPRDCIAPIAHFSNGTGARCVFYRGLLKHWASHGYIASCFESSSTGSGEACYKGLEAAGRQNNASLAYILSSGHSQGGSASNHCAFKLEQRGFKGKGVVVGVQSAWGMGWTSYRRDLPKIKMPNFEISGSKDTVISPPRVGAGYKLITSEKYWYSAEGASHMNPQNWAQVGGLVFANWKLLDSEYAKEYFLALPNSREWSNMD